MDLLKDLLSEADSPSGEDRVRAAYKEELEDIRKEIDELAQKIDQHRKKAESSPSLKLVGQLIKARDHVKIAITDLSRV